ncbi:MAG: type II secretion system F family protein [bacterium]
MVRSFERVAYKIFGRQARAGTKRNAHLGTALQKAHIPVRPDVYLSSAYLIAALAGILAALPVVFILLLGAGGRLAVSPTMMLFLVPAPIIITGIVYLVALVLPDMRALSRVRNINAKLPYALNYLSTMAAAGATPESLFATLAVQPIYGDVSEEAAWIVRDLRVLGLDVITALQRGIDRSPSPKFQDLLQGTVTALTSGGDLKTYFANKADQYIVENRQDQRRFLDGLGVLAESFVTVVVAAPLFLIVILSVMSSFGGSPEQTLFLGYSLVFFLIPISQLAFAWTIKVMTPEA